MGEAWPGDRTEAGMRQLIDHDLTTLVSRLLVGGVFIVASFYKIIDPGGFAKSIWYYHMVPGDLINLMALIMPWMELVCGIAVIAGLFYRGSIVLINVMMLVFIIALSSAVFRGINIDCGCFKAAQESNESALNALYFDLALMVPAVHLILSKSRRWMLRPS